MKPGSKKRAYKAIIEYIQSVAKELDVDFSDEMRAFIFINHIKEAVLCTYTELLLIHHKPGFNKQYIILLWRLFAWEDGNQASRRYANKKTLDADMIMNAEKKI